MDQTLVDHVLHGTGALEGVGAGQLLKTGSNVVFNPCPRHPMLEICYLDKTSKQGVCEVCLPTLLKSHHELLPIRQTVEEVVQVLATLDEQVLQVQQRKRF